MQLLFRLLIVLQFHVKITKILFRQFQRAISIDNEVERYLRNDYRLNENSSWEYWKNKATNYSKLTQMIKSVLSCSIFSIKIERVFNFVKKVCTWDRAQFNAKFIEQVMMLKYYNRIMNLNLKTTLIESWDIFNKEVKKNRKIDENDDSFKAKLKNVLNSLNY